MLPKKAIRNRLGGLAVLGLAATAIIWQAGDRSESKESSKVESTRQGSASGHQGVQDVAGLRRLVTSSPVEDYPGLMKQVQVQQSYHALSSVQHFSRPLRQVDFFKNSSYVLDTDSLKGSGGVKDTINTSQTFCAACPK
ncbi:MAG: hypothetical protein EOP85_10165 [Verrucomicrobiaceae bacterium]|nr:MAG: hypothetical protein EOP85_10165 [Verrucomicrobiaceae bacterium]